MAIDKWSDEPLVINGKPLTVLWNETTHQIAQFFGAADRKPWPYDFAPHFYVSVLLGKGRYYFKKIIPAMARKPNKWLKRIDQDHRPNAPILFSNANRSTDKLKEFNETLFLHESEQQAHRFLSISIAASFELATRTQNFTITPENHHLKTTYPDWPTFWAQSPHHRKFVCIEADMATKDLTSSDPKKATVEKQLTGYLNLMAQGVLNEDTFVAIVTIEKQRAENIRTLIHNIGRRGDYDGAFAKRFGVRYQPFNRYLRVIAPLSDWAVTQDWERIGKLSAFNFMKPEE